MLAELLNLLVGLLSLGKTLIACAIGSQTRGHVQDDHLRRMAFGDDTSHNSNLVTLRREPFLPPGSYADDILSMTTHCPIS